MNLKFFLLGLYCCGTLSVASGAVKEIRVTPPAEGGDATRMVAEALREAGEVRYGWSLLLEPIVSIRSMQTESITASRTIRMGINTLLSI